MQNFSFQSTTEIVFGKDTESQVADLIRKYGGSRVLLHYGGGSIKKSGLYDRVVKALKDGGLYFVELGGVVPNPRWSLVQEGDRLCRAERLDFILAVGGGSVIDSTKAMAAQVVSDKNVWDHHYMVKNPVEQSLPFGTILTIPAAGSEMSNSAVITNTDVAIKTHAFGPAMLPKFSIMNPVNTYTMPAFQVACGATDIMAHMMERYFTRDTGVDVSDRLLEGAMKSLIFTAPRALKEPENYEVRAELMWLGTVAHNNFLGCGRTEDWASHAMEHELSALYDIAHGAGLAIVFPAWMKYVNQEQPSRFVQFANRVFSVGGQLNDSAAIVEAGIEALEAWFRKLGMATRLSELNLPTDAFEEMAKKACVYGPVGGFKPLGEKDVVEVYKLAT